MLNQINPHIFPRYESAAPAFARLNFKRFHKAVFMVRVVMKNGEGFDVRHLRQAHAFLPGRMTPTDF